MDNTSTVCKKVKLMLVAYIARRLVSLPIVLLGLAVIVFTISHIVPSNPAYIWAGYHQYRAEPELIKEMVEKYHLNESIPIQFYYYLKSLLSGDLGVSPMTRRPVIQDLKVYFPNTIELGVAAILIAIVVGIPIGILSALHKDKIPDHIGRLFCLLGMSMPTFWLGLTLQIIFYYNLEIFPAGERISQGVMLAHPLQRITGFLILDSILTTNWHAFTSLIYHLILPATTLAFHIIALIARITRTSMLAVLNQDYITTARAMGLPRNIIIYKNALKNAMLSIITVTGSAFAWLLTGCVMTEVVFSWPGVARYAVGAVLSFDFPAIMAFILFTGLAYSVINLVVDILYTFADPRIRYGRG